MSPLALAWGSPVARRKGLVISHPIPFTRPPMSFVQRLKIEAEDTLRYHPAVRSCLCAIELLKDRTPPAADPQAIARSIVRLCAAARLAASQPQRTPWDNARRKVPWIRQIVDGDSGRPWLALPSRRPL